VCAVLAVDIVLLRMLSGTGSIYMVLMYLIVFPQDILSRFNGCWTITPREDVSQKESCTCTLAVLEQDILPAGVWLVEHILELKMPFLSNSSAVSVVFGRLT
jgi:hypothetical protein